jgi:CubicO group peptidase (beta-lactamase class C family)
MINRSYQASLVFQHEELAINNNFAPSKSELVTMRRIVKNNGMLILLALTLVLGGCSQTAETPAETPTARSTAAPIPPPTRTPIEERISRIENGLIPISAEGQIDSSRTGTLAERMAHHMTPGLSIAVINDFQIEWAKGYGVLEAGENDSVTTETLFHAGSVAKPVSAAAVLALVERGSLDLDADVNEALLSWKVPDNDYTEEEKVTIRRLLSHSSGLRDGFTNRSSSDPIPTYTTPAGEAPSVTIQQLLDAEPGVDVDRPTHVASVPGSAYQYANTGYAIVEMAAVDVVQWPFDEIMDNTLLAPLEMTSSTYEQPLPADLRNRAATEHDFLGMPLEGERRHFPILAAGGLWTTPSDLARFAEEIMRAYNGQSSKIISQEMAREMLSAQIDTPDEPLSDAYGLGFHVAGDGQDLVIHHTGGTWGSTSLLWFYPETGQGAVIMTNSAAGHGLIRFEILLSIADEYGWSMAPFGE